MLLLKVWRWVHMELLPHFENFTIISANGRPPSNRWLLKCELSSYFHLIKGITMPHTKLICFSVNEDMDTKKITKKKSPKIKQTHTPSFSQVNFQGPNKYDSDVWCTWDYQLIGWHLIEQSNHVVIRFQYWENHFTAKITCIAIF